MADSKLCAICNKRKAKRFCPGMSESICSTCCGTEREVKIDCPFDCSYLRESRRYESGRMRPSREMPFPDIEVSDSFLAVNEQLIGRIAYHLLQYALENPRTTDADIEGALEKLVRTYQTLVSGIYYESLPENPGQVGVFRSLQNFFQEQQEEAQKSGGIATLKETDVLRSLVFLDRLATVNSNQRPRGRAFIDFLRQAYPEASSRKEESKLVIPG
ncbi:MAG: hypothetical protein O7E51_01060 [Acidobacteria bacterium]|nr:hypothetical protein [Acidobacteriota bacterium]